MRVLIIRRGALGDVVVTIPLLLNLRKLSAGCYIEIVGDNNYWSIAYPSFINKITDKDSIYINSLFLDKPLSGGFADYYKGFDLVIGFVENIDIVKDKLLKSGLSRFVLKKPFNVGGHIIDHTNSVLDGIFDLDHKIKCPYIEIDKSSVFYAKQLLLQYCNYKWLLAIHPRTYGIKGLSIEKYLEIANWLENNFSAKVIWIVGPAEEENISIIEKMWSKLSILRISNLKKLSAVISEMDLYFGCDTGISHLAAATNVNSIVLFGPTNPHVWGPRGRNVQILKTNDLCRLNLGVIKDIISNTIGKNIGTTQIMELD